MADSHIAIIVGSSRHQGHTQTMTEQLLQMVDADVFNLLDYRIHPYSYDHEHEDDFIGLMEELLNYKTLILATPVYWYSMSAWLKTFLDRWSDCVRVRKDIGRQMAGKGLAALSCGSEETEVHGFFEPFRLTAGYLDMHYLGAVHVWSLRGEINTECQKRLSDFSQLITTH